MIFDLDGTLFDTERLISECVSDASAEKGWTIEQDTIIDCIGTTYEETERIVRDAMGPDYPYNEILELSEQKFRVFVDHNGIPFKNGVLRILDRLDSIKMPYGLATTSERSIVNEILSIAGIFDRFKVIVCGDEVENGKPDPEIYLTVAERLEVSTNEVLVFEDSSHGIDSAAAAGARVVWIPDMQDIPESSRKKCYDEIGSLDAVCDRFGELIG